MERGKLEEGERKGEGEKEERMGTSRKVRRT